MPVVFDAVMLSLYLHPQAKPPKPVPDLPERIQLLIDELEAAGEQIVIPSPVLGEFLVMTGPVDGPGYLSDLTNSDVFDIRPFDTIAAIEAAEMHRKAAATGDKKAGSKTRWQVAKVDRQIVAIAKVHGVTCIYSDDAGVKKMAEAAGIQCRGVEDLPTLPEPPQRDLFDGATAASPSSGLGPLSEQSVGDGAPRESQPAPDRPGDRQGDPTQQQQDSSPRVAPPPRSKK